MPEAAPFAAAIDGTDGRSWRLPLEPLSASSLEAHSQGDQPELDRLQVCSCGGWWWWCGVGWLGSTTAGRHADHSPPLLAAPDLFDRSLPPTHTQAAARLVQNHEAVTRFCLRGAPGGKRGPRPVSAALCDPTAIPALEHTPGADAALRHVAHALLVGVETKQAGPHALTSSAEAGHDGAPVVPALGYLRQRVCVPRDLRLPAARQFRAHLSWAMEQLAGSGQ